jgi:hypothetical protein
MPTRRHRRDIKPDRIRALELLASCDNGCPEGILTAWRPTRSERHGDDWTECSTRIGLAPGNRHSASTAATGTTEYLVRSKNSCGD